MTMALCCLPRPPQTELSMYAPGRTTDTVMHSGDDGSHTMPFNRGYPPPLTGSDLAENLMKFPKEREFPFVTTAEKETLCDVQEYLCYVDAEHDTELTTVVVDKEKTCELPNGNIITVIPNGSVARKCGFSRTVPIFESYTVHRDILRLVGRDPAKFSVTISRSKNTISLPPLWGRLLADMDRVRKPTSLQAKSPSPSAPKFFVPRQSV